ncbi:MAG TPA: TonB family protein, partial [Terriglobales bacterium]|nr:TonB family protein [Terriglobales bacterium]
ATAGLMADLKFRGIYGFSPGDYQLPIQTTGDLPAILPSELPPRFEQYLIVEVTIDIDGRVADARLVTGEATPRIEQTLLAAIRGFKYVPARRNGAPIPSQLDIVVHIPS